MHALSLEYHDVVDPSDVDGSGFPGAGPASYKLTRQAFDEHLAAIAARIRYAPTTVLEWMTRPSSGRPLFLTFDDGGVSAHQYIADALERHGWRGHFFVTGSRMGSATFLTGAQARDLRDRGHVIGSHSYSHPARMGALGVDQLRAEWQRSCGMLADALGEPVLTASVPGGFYTRRVGETAAEAGLRALFTSAPTTRCGRCADCLIIGRYTLRRWSTRQTAAGLASGAWTPRTTQSVVYGALTVVRTVAGDHYTRIRQIFWGGR